MEKQLSQCDSYKVGAIQLKPQAGQIDANVAEAEKLIAQAAAAGARLVLLPELWAIGYGVEAPQAYAESFGGRVTNFMCEQAQKHGIYIAGGYAEKGQNGHCYDAALLLDPKGNLLLNHRKVHLYSALEEDKVWSPGERFEVADTELGGIGILICYDGDFAESWRMLACRGAGLILHPSAYESPCENYGWWNKLYEAYALSNAVWCVSANIVCNTHDNASHFFGWSRIINPLGEQIAAATYVPPSQDGQSELLLAELDFSDALTCGRERNGCLLADRKPHLYGAPAFTPTQLPTTAARH